MTIIKHIKLTALSVSYSDSPWNWQAFTQICTGHWQHFSLPSVWTVWQLDIFVTFCGINTITTAVTVRSPSATNETPNVNNPTSYHPLTVISWMAPWKQWLVAPQAEYACVTVAGMAQWLCWLQIDGRGMRWLRESFASAHHAGSQHIPELRHCIGPDELAS